MKITKRLPKMKLVALVSLFALASVTQIQFITPASASTQMPLDQVTAISASNNASTCAISAGVPYCWGFNNNGQLGDGTKLTRTVPVPVDTSGVLSGKSVSQIDTGLQTSCALAEGNVYCWGTNLYGILGNGSSITESTTPVAVDTSTGMTEGSVTKIAIGAYNVCALTSSADIYCWGNNRTGLLSTDEEVDELSVPVAIDRSGELAGKTITDISIGTSTACAIADSRAYCWGSNEDGRLGTGEMLHDEKLAPTAVDTSGVLANKIVTSIGVGLYSTCALAESNVYCWGGNYNGTLGNNSTDASPVPVAVDTSGVLSGKKIDQLSVGFVGACVLAEARAYCWGNNLYGQLGNGLTSNSLVPVAVDTSGVLSGKDISTIDYGADHVCALAQNTAYCWGYNLYGQLGSSKGESSYVPIAVTGSTPRSTISSTNFSSRGSQLTLILHGSRFGSVSEAIQRSMVTLNDTILPFCSEGTGSTAAEIVENGAATPDMVSDTPPCYVVLDSGAVGYSSEFVEVFLPSDFDTTAEGTVSVNGSPVYTFNKTTGGTPDPVQPVAMIKGVKQLTEHPTIPTRPTFTGVAEPFSQVTVTVHSDPISCSTTADASGNWSCTLPSNLPAGEHTVYVHITAPDSTVTNLGPYAVTVDGQTSGVVTPDSPLIPGVPNTSLIDLMKVENEHTYTVATQGIVTWSITGAVSIAAAALLFMRYRRHFKRFN